ncbi:MAG: hypothetical protein KF761_08525 [Salinibacterium sp.]|nr:hypothetical protein [Salinibacterium sp.]
MRPPLCDVCGADCAADGKLVHFALRDSDRLWHERAAAEGFVGHPPEALWLCAAHVVRGEELLNFTVDVALTELTTAAPSSLPELRQVPIRPMVSADLQRWLRTRLAGLAHELGIRGVEVHTSAREWTPMDRSVEPNCPYIDRDTYCFTSAQGTIELQWERAMWNDDDVARTSAVIAGSVSGTSFRVGGHSMARADVIELLITGEPPAAVERLITELG